MASSIRRISARRPNPSAKPCRNTTRIPPGAKLKTSRHKPPKRNPEYLLIASTWLFRNLAHNPFRIKKQVSPRSWHERRVEDAVRAYRDFATPILLLQFRSLISGSRTPHRQQ